MIPKDPCPSHHFSATSPYEGTHGLHGFASKSRDGRISRKGLEPEWPQYPPRHLTGTMSNKKLCRKRSYFLPSSSPVEIKVGGISGSRFLVISEKALKQLLGLPRQILSPGISIPAPFVLAPAALVTEAKTSDWGQRVFQVVQRSCSAPGAWAVGGIGRWSTPALLPLPDGVQVLGRSVAGEPQVR